MSTKKNVEKNYFIKGQDISEKTGSVMLTNADSAWDYLTKKNNLSNFDSESLFKIKDGDKVLLDVLYQDNTKFAIETKSNGQEYTIKVNKNKQLSNLTYVKTHAFVNGTSIKLNKPFTIFQPNQYVENLMEMCFFNVLNQKAEREIETKNGMKKVTSTREYFVPKSLKLAIRRYSENILAIVDSIKMETLNTQIKKAQREPDKKHYLNDPQVAKNLGRLVAMLEKHPNIVLLMPKTLMSLEILQDAFVKGKELEGLRQPNQIRTFENTMVNSLNEKTGKYEKISFKQDLKDSLSIANSKTVYDRILDNFDDAFGKINITKEDIKQEYEKALKELETSLTLEKIELKETDKVHGYADEIIENNEANIVKNETVEKEIETSEPERDEDFPF